MRRPSFQFYPGDWLGNSNLRRCTHTEKGCWVDVMCLMHDSSAEYGVLRWPLQEIAQAAGCHVDQLRSLISKGVLKGADTGEILEPFVYVPRSGRKDGEPVMLIPAQPGPVWYSSRMVRDDYVNRHRGGQTRFTADNQPGQDIADNHSPNRPIGDGKGVHPTIHPTRHHAFTTLPEESAEAGDVGHGSLNSVEKAPKTSPIGRIGDGQGDGPSSSTSSSTSLGNTSSDQAKPDPIPPCPHEELIRLFGEKLPALPQPRPELWIGEKQKAMRARWRWVLTAKRATGERYATTSEEALAWFGLFFDDVADSDFLTGRNGRWTGCNLNWLMGAKNFANVLEGIYNNKEAAHA